jgi:outer membrane receptor for ferric coprogen and ferric-rhodotorulic acid
MSTFQRAGRWTAISAIAALGIAAGVPQAAAQQTPSPVQRTHALINFSIPAGSLGEALTTLGRQARLQITFDPALTAGQRSEGLSGSFGAQDALGRLLAGMGISYRFANATTVVLEKQAAGTVNVPAASVDATRLSDPGMTEGSGSYAGSKVSVGSKIPASIRETPQSVSVITRDRMDDEGFVTLSQAVAETTGMRVTNWDYDRASYKSRGFDASILRDGVAIANVTNMTAVPDLAMYDRVEVMRGPAGLFHGAGEPGGSINLVRKRALDHVQIGGLARVGSWDYYRAEGDVTGPLVESGRARGRLVAAYQDKEYFVDRYDSEAPFVYGTVEVDLTPDTTLSVGMSYYRNDRASFYGIPGAYTNNTPIYLPRSTNLSANWARTQDHEEDYFGELTHRFESGAEAKLSARHVYRSGDGFLHYVTSGVNPANGNVNMEAWSKDDANDINSMDANISVPLDALGQTQKLLFGADYSMAKVDSTFGRSAAFTGNVFNFDPNIAQPATPFNQASSTDTEQMGAYAQANFKPGLDWLTFVVGARATWWNAVNRSITTTSTSGSDVNVNGEIVPKYGVVADITKELSAYASHAAIFVPQTNLTPTREFVAPRTGTQYEAGLKGEFYDGSLIGHVAVYQLEDENRATTIQGCTGSFCSEAAGVVRSQGLEAEVSGEPFPNWQLMAGYAYSYSKYVEDPTNKGRDYSPDTPNHLFNASATYKFRGGELDGFSIGGGTRIRGPYYFESSGIRYVQDEFALFDARVGYDLTENLSASFSINNIFDEEYYERYVGVNRNNYWGEPRSVMFTVRAKW